MCDLLGLVGGIALIVVGISRLSTLFFAIKSKVCDKEG